MKRAMPLKNMPASPALKRAAYAPNIKERMDDPCAI
jgi:N-methylhydantoinase B/oxoprolinase/acetone carboxylase alpha subunit